MMLRNYLAVDLLQRLTPVLRGDTLSADVHRRAERFFDYGDVSSCQQGLLTLRRDWSDAADPTA